MNAGDDLVLMHREELQRLAHLADRDGDEHGIAHALREALASAPQPTSSGDDEVVCLECGQPTMPMGQVCYSCLHPSTAPPSGGESEPMTGDLLPCPFCGKSNQDRWPCEWLDGSGANVIRCAWCHGAAPMNVWNRRTAPPSAPVGVEDIEVLRRIRAALPDVGLNGWIVGVQALDRVIEALAQQPAADEGDAEQFRKGWQAGFAEGRRDQQPAAMECPHRTRCDCLAACKYGFAGDGMARPGGAHG